MQVVRSSWGNVGQKAESKPPRGTLRTLLSFPRECEWGWYSSLATERRGRSALARAEALSIALD